MKLINTTPKGICLAVQALSLFVLMTLLLSGCTGARAPKHKPSLATGQAPAEENPELALKGLETAVWEQKSMADRALKRRDYDFASLQYNNLNNLLQQKIVKEQVLASQNGEPQPERDLKPVEEAAAAHRRLAERFLRDGNVDLAVAEYQTAANLLQFAERRVQQNLAARQEILNNEEHKAQRALQEKYSKEAGREGLSETERQKLNQENADNLNKLSEKYEPQRKKTEEQMVEPRKDAEKRSDDLTMQRVKLYQEIAKAFEQKGDKIQARQSTSSAMQEQAVLYERRHDLAKAEATYRALLKNDPQLMAAGYNLVRILKLENKWPEAEKELRAQLEAYPENLGARLDLVQVFTQQKKWEAAVQQEQEIIRVEGKRLKEVSPTDPNAAQMKKNVNDELSREYISLGRLLTQASRTAEANQAFKKAALLNPEAASWIPLETKPAQPSAR